MGPKKWQTCQSLTNALKVWASLSELRVERVGVPSAESGNFSTFTDSSCCALSALVLALSAHYIQKVQKYFALFQHEPLSRCRYNSWCFSYFQQQICRNNTDSKQTSADTKKVTKFWTSGNQDGLTASLSTLSFLHHSTPTQNPIVASLLKHENMFSK